jgi:hypothetical protein
MTTFKLMRTSKLQLGRARLTSLEDERTFHPVARTWDVELRDGHLDWVPKREGHCHLQLLPGLTDTRHPVLGNKGNAFKCGKFVDREGTSSPFSLAFCFPAFGGCRCFSSPGLVLVLQEEGFLPLPRSLALLAYAQALPLDLAVVPAGCCRHGAHLHQVVPEALLQAGDAYPHGRSRRSW